MSITIEQAQKTIDEWIKSVGVRYFNPLTNLGILMEESGELARLMVRAYGDQSYKHTDEKKEISDEIADVLWVLICIANQCEVDLTEAFKKNLEKKTLRDFNRHKENPKLNNK